MSALLRPAGETPVLGSVSYAHSTSHRARRRFIPSRWNGNYKLPRSANELLTVRLFSFRNRDAAHKLAVFLGRMNSGPRRINTKRGPYGIAAFPIDRRVLKDNKDLGLTEAQIRGAIKTLIAVGFIEVVEVDGSAYQSVTAADGTPGVYRKPIQYKFAGQFENWFAFLARKLKSPKETFFQIPPKEKEENLDQSANAVLLGEKRERRRLVIAPPTPVRVRSTEDDPALLAALARWGLNAGFPAEKRLETSAAEGRLSAPR
jgi:hypothetical protein